MGDNYPLTCVEDLWLFVRRTEVNSRTGRLAKLAAKVRNVLEQLQDVPDNAEELEERIAELEEENDDLKRKVGELEAQLDEVVGT